MDSIILRTIITVAAAVDIVAKIVKIVSLDVSTI